MDRVGNPLPFPTPGDLPNPGIEPASPASPAMAGKDSLPLYPLESRAPHLLGRYFQMFLHLSLTALVEASIVLTLCFQSGKLVRQQLGHSPTIRSGRSD